MSMTSVYLLVVSVKGLFPLCWKQTQNFVNTSSVGNEGALKRGRARLFLIEYFKKFGGNCNSINFKNFLETICMNFKIACMERSLKSIFCDLCHVPLSMFESN